jgi:NADPH2:quinone reductase
MSGTHSGDFPRMPTTGKRFLAGRRILEVFWLGYRLPRLDETAQRQLVQEIVTLLRGGVILPPRRQCL